MTQVTFTDLVKSYQPSGTLWRAFAPPSSLSVNGTEFIGQSGNPAFGFFDNFLTFNETTLVGPYAHLNDGGTVAKAADTADAKGVLSLVAEADAGGDVTTVKWGSTLSAPFKLAGNDLVFEARISINNITTLKNGFFVGLAEADAIGDNGLITDADAIADNNLLGFVSLSAETTNIDGCYKADGQTAQDGSTKSKLLDLIPSADVFTADNTNYVKVGFRYRSHPEKVEWFVNGTLAGTTAAPARITASEIAAATFPGDTFLAPYIGFQTVDANALTVNLDWWGCAQYL